MGRLSRFALVGVLALTLAGCGPTAEAITTPTPARPGATSGPPTTGAPPASPGTPGSDAPQTPISLSTPTPGDGPPATDIPLPTAPSTEIWQPLTDFPVSDAFEVTSVTTTPAGFVAVGFRAMQDEGFFGRRQGVLWRSSDGRAWEAQLDPVFEFVTPEDIAALGDSLFVFGTLETCDLTIGDDCEEPPEAGWGIWRSVAGGPWERLATPESMRVGTMDGVTVAHGALIASGWSGDEAQSAIFWRSTDGITWTETTDLAGMDPVTALAQIPSGIVAFGSRFLADQGDLELLIAVSTDGAQFAPVAAPALFATTIQAVEAGPSGVVAVGDGDDFDVGFNGVILFSADGLSWTQASASDQSLAGTTLRAVHALPNGYVALGLMPDIESGDAAGASWISADGLIWRHLAPLGGTFSLLDTSAVGPTGVVAFTVTDVGFDDEAGSSEVDVWFAPIEVLQP